MTASKWETLIHFIEELGLVRDKGHRLRLSDMWDDFEVWQEGQLLPSDLPHPTLAEIILIKQMGQVLLILLKGTFMNT